MLIKLAHELQIQEPFQLLKELEKFYSCLEKELETCTNSLTEPPCFSGCSDCCHESVFLSAEEFFYVANYLLSTWPWVDRQKLTEEMSAIYLRYEDEMEMLTGFKPGSERDEVALRVKFSCPFLDTQGLCRIYPVREINARIFGLSWDEKNKQAYGCDKTKKWLPTIKDPSKRLVKAREVRKRFVQQFQPNNFVHVYPYWFYHYGIYLVNSL